MSKNGQNYFLPASTWTPVIILFLLQACGDNKDKIKVDAKITPPPPPLVEIYIAKKGPVSENLDFPGTILAYDATELHPEISGRLTYLNIPEGKAIQAGSLIARIYDGDLKAQLGKLKVQLETAEQTAKRYESLLSINGVSKQEYDLKKLEISNIKADIEIVQSNLRRTEVRAPFSGILGLKMVSTGAYVTPATLLSTLREQDRLQIQFSLPERYMGKVHEGQDISFRTEGNAKSYAARIAATESEVSENSRSLMIRADILEGDRELTPGSFVNVHISLNSDSAALMIPSEAILPQPRGKKAALLKEGIVSFVTVETGLRDISRIQVMSGISAGDTIILTGLMGLKPDSKVRIQKIRE